MLTTLLRSRLIAGLLLLLLLLAASSRLPVLISYFWSNAGSLALNQQPSIVADASWAKATAAEGYFLRALRRSPQQYSAQRGLGHVLAAHGQEAQARERWQATDLRLPVEMVEWGEKARADQDYDSAYLWYERAAAIAPQFGDVYFYRAQAYEAQQAWPAALAAYEQGLREDVTFWRVGRSNLLFQAGQIYQQDLVGEQPLETAIALYEQALAVDDFHSSWARTQTRYRLGEALARAGRPAEAAPLFAAVIEARPAEALPYVKLAEMKLALGEEAAAVEALLRTALEKEPDSKWAYRVLGQLYQQNNQIERARRMYERVLEIDPGDDLARSQLATLETAPEA